MSNLTIDLFSKEGAQKAASLLANGNIVALPTDTVPGLFGCASFATTANMLSDLKGSAPDKVYSWHLANLSTLRSLTPQLPAGLHPWLLETLERQSTVLLPSNFVAIPEQLDWPFDKTGFRLPLHADFQAVAELCPAPLLGTSINNSGASPLSGGELIEWLIANDIHHAAQLVDCEPNATPSNIIDLFPEPAMLRGDDAALDNIGLSILVVCTGNTCRSPLGAELLKSEISSSWGVSLDKLQDFGWRIESAGTFALADQACSDNSQNVAQQLGLELSAHLSQPLAVALEDQWDLILGMSNNHLAALPKNSPAALFSHSENEISDPFGSELAIYQQTGAELLAAAQQWVAELSRWPER